MKELKTRKKHLVTARCKTRRSQVHLLDQGFLRRRGTLSRLYRSRRATTEVYVLCARGLCVLVRAMVAVCVFSTLAAKATERLAAATLPLSCVMSNQLVLQVTRSGAEDWHPGIVRTNPNDGEEYVWIPQASLKLVLARRLRMPPR